MSERMRIAVLGCTGSIGRQTLDVCRQNPDKLDVVALSVHGSTDGLVEAARTFGARSVCVSDPAHAADPVLDELPDSCELLVGPDGLIELCERDDVDCVLNAVVGAAGLRASYAALRAGKRLALANKESLVVGGDLLMPLAARDQLLPVDSEHGAIFQCLVGEQRSRVHAIWLTCSGGPFFGMSHTDLESVTPGRALRHPAWSMGPKISIDSATLMNKGLERIEAMHLFHMPLERIIVLIQREAKIHSMVEFSDGSVIAQLGTSDMRIPIQYALSYPERWEAPCKRMDFRTIGSLSFDAPDTKAFPCLALAERAGVEGGTCPAVLNAANEVAVEAFLGGSCGFNDIARIVEGALDAHVREDVESLEQLAAVDAWARSFARTLIK
ncbi:1-deoxy-D-xylulose-5-phosphate reductoisomerase [[Collinsella] massiliensis]|nr:1-deoxy-D-xylulose-5-phosphate reductoisomerase [[Collinsella] massiliensis]